jgi:hypothetical protein
LFTGRGSKSRSKSGSKAEERRWDVSGGDTYISVDQKGSILQSSIYLGLKSSLKDKKLKSCQECCCFLLGFIYKPSKPSQGNFRWNDLFSSFEKGDEKVF